MLQFHGGKIFGKAVNDSSLKAETILCNMVNCLNGGPKFHTNMIPVAKLNTQFLVQQVNQSVESIENATGKLKAIICEGNRTNQSFLQNIWNYTRKSVVNYWRHLSSVWFCTSDQEHMELVDNWKELWTGI